MSAKILWGSDPPPHVANPGPAQMLYLGPDDKDLCPGLLTLGGGVQGFKYRMEQEERTFTTFVYFSGFKVPAWTASFVIWNGQQYTELLRLHKKYAPRPIASFRDRKAVQVTNPVLNEHGFRTMLINDWAPPASPQEGMSYIYSMTLIEGFPRRFVPKPPSAAGANKNGNVFDRPQSTDRAINPRDEDMLREWNALMKQPKTPVEVYQTPAVPKVWTNSLGEVPDMQPEAPE